VCECVWVCGREREKEGEGEMKRESVCVCVRERKSVCVWLVYRVYEKNRLSIWYKCVCV